MIAFSDIPAVMLGPLEGTGDEAWFHALPGQWCPGQVVDHVATAIESSARVFRSRTDKPPMQRRPPTLRQRIFKVIVFGTGFFPPGRKAPETTLPAQRPERAVTERRLRDAVAAFLELERALLPARANDLYVKHPVFGDLTLEEWMTFHCRHSAHHAKQVRARVPSAP
ncbi:MAG: DinB family protein [Gemmatimonadales bacterium]